MKINQSIGLLTGLTIFSFVTINFLISFIGFVLKLPINLSYFYITAVISLLINFLVTTKFELKQSYKIVSHLTSVMLVVITFLFCLIVSQNFYDTSYDGQAYHGEAIIQLSSGWNPIYERSSGYNGKHQTWLNAYPKAAWVNEAVIYKLTGKIESAKMFNLWLLFATFMLVISALLSISFKKENPVISKWWIIAIALVLILNPISLYQSLNLYIDGQMYLAMLALLSVFILYLYNRDTKLKYILQFLFVLIAIYLFNIKLVGLVFGSIFLIGILVYSFLKQKESFKEVLLTVITIFISGFLVFGYNPYITNLIYNGNSLYPIFGKNAYNFKDENLPIDLRKQNNLTILLQSGFLETNNQRGKQDYSNLKIPFTLSNQEIKTLGAENIKKGGLGPYFGGSLILVFLGLIYVIFKIYKKEIEIQDFLLMFVVILLILISAGINSASTYARFVPQLWIVPGLFVFYLVSKNRKDFNIIAGLITLVLLGNSFLMISNYIPTQLELTSEIKTKLEYLKTNHSETNPVVVNFGIPTATRERFNEYKIPYQETDILLCKNHKTYYLPQNESDICY